MFNKTTLWASALIFILSGLGLYEKDTLPTQAVLAQTSPGLITGQIPTAAQWNSYFSSKQDYPIPGIVTGALTGLSGDVVASGPNVGASVIQPSVVTNAKLASAAAQTIKGNNTTGVASVADLTIPQVRGLYTLPVLVTDPPYNAACNAAGDDSAAINAALAAVSNGQTVLLPFAKTCRITSGLVIGNGNSTTLSTINGVVLGCQAIPQALSIFGSMPAATGCKLIWGGSPGGTMITIQGPIQGYGVNHIYVECNNAAGIGLLVTSGLYPDVQGNVFANCTTAQIKTATLPAFGGNDLNSEGGRFDNNILVLPNVASVMGMFLTSQSTDASSNTHNIFWTRTSIYAPLVTTVLKPIVLQSTDSNSFVGMQIFGGGSGCTAVTFDYSLHNSWPADNKFYNIDPDTSNCATAFANVGTPGSSATPNYVHVVETNGSAVPTNIANLAALGSHQIVLAQPANGNNVTVASLSGTALYNFNLPTSGAGSANQVLTSGGGGSNAMTWTDIGAWSTFAPSLTCGNATFVTGNSFQSKTIGKTTTIQLDVQVNAIGTTCTNTNNIAFTLPNTPQTPASLFGRNIGNNTLAIGCSIIAGSTSVSCSHVDGTISWAASDRFELSGVYQNQ